MGGDDEEKRLRVKQEILATERSYVADLLTAVEVFMKPMLAVADDPIQSVASRDEVRTIFNNLESILSLNQQLLVALEEENSTGQTSIGQIFIDMAPFLKMYCTYVNNHTRAVEMHRELVSKGAKKDTVSRYQAFLNNLAEKNQERLKNRQLNDLLIMPVQRVPRYRLLLEELLKRTQGDEYEVLEMGLAKIADVANLVNERLRDFENRMMVVTIEERLGKATPLVQPHRVFVMEGILQKVCRRGPKEYVFILLSDVLIYGLGTNTGATPYDHEQAVTFKRQIDLVATSLTPISETSFKLSSPTKSFVIIANDASTKDTWFNAIQACVTSCVTRAMETSEVASLPHTNSSATLLTLDELAPVWVPDKEAPCCQLPECGVKFTVFTRRHHCRMCGLVVCAECSPHRWHLPNIDKVKAQRICNQCYFEIRSKLEEDNFESAGNLNTPRPAAPAPVAKTPGVSTTSALFHVSAGIFARILKAAPSAPVRLANLQRTVSGSERDQSSVTTYSSDTRKNKSESESSSSSSDDIPRNWRALKDEHGRTYYWHVITDSVQYEKPTGRVKNFKAAGPTGPARDSDSGSSNSPNNRNISALKTSSSFKLVVNTTTSEKHTSPIKSTKPSPSVTFSSGTSFGNDKKQNSSNDSGNNLVPPGSPMMSNNNRKGYDGRRSNPALAKHKSMIGPTLAERLQMLSDQGVFGDVKLAKFNVKTSANRGGDGQNNGFNPSPLLSPRVVVVKPVVTGNGLLGPPKNSAMASRVTPLGSTSQYSSSPALGAASQYSSSTPVNASRSGLNGNSFTSSPSQSSRPSSVSGLTPINSTGSPFANPRPLSGAQTSPFSAQPSASSQMAKPKPVMPPNKPLPQVRPAVVQGNNVQNNFNRPTGSQMGQNQQPLQQTRSPVLSARFQVPINQSQGKPEVAKMTDSEFLKVMGVSRNDFDKYPAYKKVELKQAKNVA